MRGPNSFEARGSEKQVTKQRIVTCKAAYSVDGRPLQGREGRNCEPRQKKTVSGAADAVQSRRGGTRAVSPYFEEAGAFVPKRHITSWARLWVPDLRSDSDTCQTTVRGVTPST